MCSSLREAWNYHYVLRHYYAMVQYRGFDTDSVPIPLLDYLGVYVAFGVTYQKFPELVKSTIALN